MKTRVKINRGVIMFAVLLAIMIIYLVIVGAIHKADEEEITDSISEYLSIIDDYQVLPDEYLQDNSLLTDDQIKTYIALMETDIKPLFVDNVKAYSGVLSDTEDNINQQIEKSDFYSKLVSTLEKDSVEIVYTDNDYVQVTFMINRKYVNKSKEDTFRFEQTASLCKIDGKWLFENVHSTELSDMYYQEVNSVEGKY